jgi:hypothetical protein
MTLNSTPAQCVGGNLLKCKNTSSKCHSLKFIEVNGKKKKEETTSQHLLAMSATGGVNILMMSNDIIETTSWHWQSYLYMY